MSFVDAVNDNQLMSCRKNLEKCFKGNAFTKNYHEYIN